MHSTVLRNIPGCAWWISLVNKLNSLVAVTAIPLRVHPHVPERLWMFHVDLSIENPRWITVPAIWMRAEQMSSTHGAEYLHMRSLQQICRTISGRICSGFFVQYGRPLILPRLTNYGNVCKYLILHFLNYITCPFRY